MVIKKTMKIGEMLSQYPQTAQVLVRNGLTCVGCPFANNETIEQGAKSHSLDLKKLLHELNKVINVKR
ncbi:MAG: DUF1858 domain-containing protein [archaeon]